MKPTVVCCFSPIKQLKRKCNSDGFTWNNTNRFEFGLADANTESAIDFAPGQGMISQLIV